MNSSNKKMYLLIIVAVVLIAIIASISYGYFNGELNNKSIGNYTIVVGDDYTLSSDGGIPVEYNVSDADMFGVSYDIVAASSTSLLNIVLQNDGAEQNVTCTYNFAWRWDISKDQYTKSEGLAGTDKKEFTISITGGGLTGEPVGEQQVPDYNETVNFGEGSITAAPGETQSIKANVTVKFYNLADINQDAHMNKSYKGGVILDNVSCVKN